jgi:hypothetical protein
MRLPQDTIRGIKRIAKRRKKSQSDFVNSCVRPVLVTEGFIKERILE